MEFLEIPIIISKRLDLVWSFLLLTVRYTTLFLSVPGIGIGLRGLPVRAAAILVLAFASLNTNVIGVVPGDWAIALLQLVSEAIFGTIIGLIPLIVVIGVQLGAQLASSSMGLNASQLIDPTSGVANSDIARIYGDIVVIMFMAIGGHHSVIYAASGLGGSLTPGAFVLSDHSIKLFIDSVAGIFKMGVMVSAPVVVALLLTQFVMGMISRAVPTVNIFVVSFPLTIGIGFIISILALPDVMGFVSEHLRTVDHSIVNVLGDFQK